jgi:hypothetical protein
MTIYVSETDLNPAGPTPALVIVQIHIRAPEDRKDLEVFAICTNRNREVAHHTAYQRALRSVEALSAKERQLLGLPPDDRLQHYMHSHMERTLACHGGAWEEERARGRGSRTRRLTGGGALDMLAAAYA